jgi:ATP/maltotriose-dependent transcriptional regulator MalT
MCARHARRLAIAQRRQQVARLYLQGQSQVEIAQELRTAQSTISKDLDKIHAAWRESAIRDFDAQRDLELARLNQIEREAWAAWERSQRPAQQAVVEGETSGSQRSRRTVRNQYGDPRFLELAWRCNEQRRKMLGLDAPTQIAPAAAEIAPLTAEQRRTHVAAILIEQFGQGAMAERLTSQERTSHGPEPSDQAAGKPDGRGAVALEPAGDDQEPLAASPPG